MARPQNERAWIWRFLAHGRIFPKNIAARIVRHTSKSEFEQFHFVVFGLLHLIWIVCYSGRLHNIQENRENRFRFRFFLLFVWKAGFVSSVILENYQLSTDYDQKKTPIIQIEQKAAHWSSIYPMLLLCWFRKKKCWPLPSSVFTCILRSNARSKHTYTHTVRST